jgi:HK97 family phage major capsid protein
MDLLKIRKQMKALYSEIEGLQEKMDSAEKAGDGKAYESAKVEFDGKTRDFEALEQKAEVAAVHSARAKKLAELDRLAGKSDGGGQDGDLDGKTIPSGTPAEPIDHDAREQELTTHFFGYLEGKTLSGQARAAMLPRSRGWKKASSGIVVPNRISRLVLPEAFCGKEMLSADNTAVIPEEMKPELMRYPAEAPAVFPRVTQVPTQTGTLKWPKLTQAAPGAEGGASEFAEHGYVACDWTAEGAEKPETTPQFEQFEITTGELAARTEISQTLLRRSPLNMEALISELFRGALLHKIDAGVINGDGTAKPEGILQASLTAVNRAGATAVSPEDLIDLEHTIAPQLRPGSVWIMADTVLKYLKKLTDQDDKPLFPRDANGQLTKINGYPVIPTLRVPALGTAGDVIFGNPRYYIAAVEQEIVVMKSEHRYMERGTVLFVVWAQVGGEVGFTRAFTKLGDPAG